MLNLMLLKKKKNQRYIGRIQIKALHPSKIAFEGRLYHGDAKEDAQN